MSECTCHKNYTLDTLIPQVGVITDIHEETPDVKKMCIRDRKYGEGTVTLIIKEQYRNMKEKIEPCMHLIDNAKKAVQQSGLNPKTVAIRGGTDGARLSFMGLPCPNLGTGGYAFHGPCEHSTVEGMDYAVENLKNIVKLYAC